MKVELVQPFVTAAARVLEAELGMAARPGEMTEQNSGLTTREVTVLIGIAGQVEGSVLYGADRATVLRVAGIMMGEEPGEIDETTMSAIAELGNMITGQAAALFEQSGLRFTISPPNVILGEGSHLRSVGIPILVIPFHVDAGVLDVAVSVRERGQ